RPAFVRAEAPDRPCSTGQFTPARWSSLSGHKWGTLGGRRGAAAAAKAAKAAEEAAQAANAGKAVEGAGAGGAAVTGLKIENTAGKLGGTEVTAEANGVKVENSFGGSGGEGSRESDPPTWFTVLIGLAIVGWIVSKFRS
ncbi:hypothetical protein, partial [Roseateles saccharophilus]